MFSNGNPAPLLNEIDFKQRKFSKILVLGQKSRRGSHREIERGGMEGGREGGGRERNRARKEQTKEGRKEEK